MASSNAMGEYIKLALEVGRILGSRDGGGNMGPLGAILNGRSPDAAVDPADEATPTGFMGLTRQQQQQLALALGTFVTRQAIAARRRARAANEESIDSLTGSALADAIENFSVAGDIDGKRGKKRTRLTLADVRRLALAEADRLIELQERLQRENVRLLKGAKLDVAQVVVPVTDETGEMITVVPIGKQVGNGGGGGFWLLGLLAGIGAVIATLKGDQRTALLKSLANVPGEIASLINEFRAKPYTTDYEPKTK